MVQYHLKVEGRWLLTCTQLMFNYSWPWRCGFKAVSEQFQSGSLSLELGRCLAFIDALPMRIRRPQLQLGFPFGFLSVSFRFPFGFLSVSFRFRFSSCLMQLAAGRLVASDRIGRLLIEFRLGFGSVSDRFRFGMGQRVTVA